MADGATGDFLEGAFPIKFFLEHALGELAGVGFCGRELQAFGADAKAVGKDYGALEGVLELANVAWPAIVKHAVAGFGRNFQAGLGEFAAEFVKEMVGEEQDVIAALAERWNGHGNGGDAEI